MDFISHQAEKILSCYTDSSINLCIKKSEENDLEKAEGSRGGHVLYHTKSGKPIYANPKHPTHKDFTSEDHSEAATKHQDIQERLLRDYNKKTKNASEIPTKADKELLERAKEEGRNSDYHRDQAEEKRIKVEKSKSDDKFVKIMGKFKAGTLKSSDGSPVTKRSQAIVIAMSESGQNVEKVDSEDETED